MSLYHEAAQILKSASNGEGSLKTLSFGQKGLKADRKTLFALTTEAAKWSEVLSEVIDASDVLKAEKQLTPTLALLLTHDLLLSRRGVALPATHGLHTAIARHKARLAAELTKARIRRDCMTIDALRDQINNASQSGSNAHKGVQHYHPRWIRINTILTTLEEQLRTTFADYEKCENLRFLATAGPQERLLYVDEHIPNLLAIQASVDLTKSAAYREGRLILQDKASCFPAYLLNPGAMAGDVIDACAAPGNKTTHLAAILEEAGSRSNITACERDGIRSKVLSGMVKLAGADKMVTVRSSQDFMKLKPQAKEFANVGCLILDPSCSGSGIVGRDEQTVTIHLPDPNKQLAGMSHSKKRKRSTPQPQVALQDKATMEDVETPEETPQEAEEDSQRLQARLTSLSTFQLRLLQHAMSFPAARRITYSTCSIHDEENEHVVLKALGSDVAVERGWRVMKRDEQVEGLRKWHRRGRLEAIEAIDNAAGSGISADQLREMAEACIRCTKESEDGTMGFFVAGLVRDDDIINGGAGIDTGDNDHSESDEDEWNGFDE